MCGIEAYYGGTEFQLKKENAVKYVEKLSLKRVAKW